MDHSRSSGRSNGYEIAINLVARAKRKRRRGLYLSLAPLLLWIEVQDPRRREWPVVERRAALYGSVAWPMFGCRDWDPGDSAEHWKST
jgi:hypothetical protein